MSQDSEYMMPIIIRTDKSSYYALRRLSNSESLVSLSTNVNGNTLTRLYAKELPTQSVINFFKEEIETEELRNEVPYPVASLTDPKYLTVKDGRISGYHTGAANPYFKSDYDIISDPIGVTTSYISTNNTSVAPKTKSVVFYVNGINVPVLIEETETRWIYSSPYLNLKLVFNKEGFTVENAVKRMEKSIVEELSRRGMTAYESKPERLSYDDFSGLVENLALDKEAAIALKGAVETPSDLKTGDSINVKIKDFIRVSRRTLAIVKDVLPDNQVELILAESTKKPPFRRKFSLWKGDISRLRDHEKVGDYLLGKAILKSYENSASAFGNKSRLKRLLDSKERLLIEEELDNYTLASGRIIPKVYKVLHEDKIIKVAASDVEVTPFDLKGWNLPKQRNLELGCKAIIKDDRKLRSIKKEDIVTIIKFMQMMHTPEKAIPRIAKVKTESGEEHLVPCKVLKRL